MRRSLCSFLIVGLFVSALSPSSLCASEATEAAFHLNNLLSDEQLFDTLSMEKSELTLLLSRGSLTDYQTIDVTGTIRNAVDIIWDAAKTFGLNPRFLLVLLQREQSLIEDNDPTQDQLDWAMGYGVCDDCLKSDPGIQKFKGFGAQVYFAAQRIRESYLKDLDERGFTEAGIGPGRLVSIDGMSIVPANRATSVLYTYTPHLEGNKNFARIWQRWFETDHVTGTLLQDRVTGGIWYIQDGLRRPITSRAAFLSRFDPKTVIPVGPSVLESYPIGRPIRFPNYSLLRSPRGTVYLIVDETRRGFTSQEAFRTHGFSPDEITDVSLDDLDAYREGEPITTQTVYPQGALLQDRSTGGVWFVQNGKKHPVMSPEILRQAFTHIHLVAVTFEDLEAYERAEPVLFPDGTLVGVKGSPDVFVITGGMRRHIQDEATFGTFGWNWDQIVWTNERSILLHPLGESLEIEFTEESFKEVSK